MTEESVWVFLIPQNELTAKMLGKSTVQTIDELTTETVNNVPYYVVTVNSEVYNGTDIFSEYTPFTKDQYSQGLAVPPSVQARKILIEGIILELNAALDSTTTSTYVFTQNFEIEYVEFKVDGFTFGDYVTVKVFDSDDNEVDEFVTTRYVSEDLYRKKIPRTIIKSGMKIRLYYTNTAILTATPDYYFNIEGYRLSVD